MICPYCDNQAEFLSSKEFYGRDYGTNLYVCRLCDARVGTHKRSSKPLGTMVNHRLRILRKICHRKFDPLWESKEMSRGKAYRWLQENMRLSPKEAHIGMFDEEQCRKLIKLLNQKEND